MKKDNLIDEIDDLVRQKAHKSNESLGSYYRKILNYCKKRI